MKLVLWLRAVFLMFYFAVHTILCSIVCVLQNFILGSRRSDDFVIKWLWSRTFLRLAGIEVEVRGERSSGGQGCLYLFNHSSYFDILVIFGALEKTPRFGAKIELFRVPFFGLAMKRVGMLPIARHQREKVLKIYQEAESRVAKGECFALAPEGTRQAQREIGRFKTGPFIFAINAQVPVVPLVLAGALDIQPKGNFLVNTKAWKTKVVLDIGTPTPTEGLTMESLVELQEKVRNQMVETYQRLNQELDLDPV